MEIYRFLLHLCSSVFPLWNNDDLMYVSRCMGTYTCMHMHVSVNDMPPATSSQAIYFKRDSDMKDLHFKLEPH